MGDTTETCGCCRKAALSELRICAAVRSLDGVTASAGRYPESTVGARNCFATGHEPWHGLC